MKCPVCEEELHQHPQYIGHIAPEHISCRFCTRYVFDFTRDTSVVSIRKGGEWHQWEWSYGQYHNGIDQQIQAAIQEAKDELK